MKVFWIKDGEDLIHSPTESSQIKTIRLKYENKTAAGEKVYSIWVENLSGAVEPITIHYSCKPWPRTRWTLWWAKKNAERLLNEDI